MASRYLDSITLPPQLPAVLDKLIKAVLRDQPKDIVEYCALYFQAQQNEERLFSRKVTADPKIRQQVRVTALKYFGNGVRLVPKDEIIKFIRVFAAEKTEIQPFPNSIEQIMHRVSTLTNSSLSFSAFVDTVAEIFSG